MGTTVCKLITMLRATFSEGFRVRLGILVLGTK